MEMTLGIQLKLLRVAQKLRQREVARRAGLSSTHLSDIENGWRVPTSGELRRLYAALRTHPQDESR